MVMSSESARNAPVTAREGYRLATAWAQYAVKSMRLAHEQGLAVARSSGLDPAEDGFDEYGFVEEATVDDPAVKQLALFYFKMSVRRGVVSLDSSLSETEHLAASAAAAVPTPAAW